MKSRTSQARELYHGAIREFGRALDRLAAGYEADAGKRHDLRQEIHFQLWRSFEVFDGRCSVKTWTFRVAHNAAVSYVNRERRSNARLVGLDEVELTGSGAGFGDLDRERALQRLSRMIHQLKPLDRQVILSYLEEMDAASIAEITGLSPASVAMRFTGSRSFLRGDFRRNTTMPDAGKLWRDQPEEKRQVLLEQFMNRRTRQLYARSRWEALVGVFAVVFLVAVVTWRLAQVDKSLSWFVIGAAAAWVAIALIWLRARIWPGAAEALAATGVEHYRQELERRLNDLKKAWLCHGPLLVASLGIVAVIFAGAVPSWKSLRNAAPFLLLLVAWVGLSIWHRRKEAAEIRREIEELDLG